MFVQSFYSFFVKLKISTGTFIMKENVETPFIYFLKSGEYEIYSYKSILEIEEIVNNIDRKLYNKIREYKKGSVVIITNNI